MNGCSAVTGCIGTVAGADCVPVRRVALLISELRPGGAERVLVYLAGELARMGLQVKVICLQRRGELASELDSTGVEVLALGSLRGYDPSAVLRLRQALAAFNPDVINVHDRSSLLYVYLATRLGWKRPVVFTAHGLLVRDERPGRRDRLAGRCISAFTAVSEPAGREYCCLLGWTGHVDVIDNGVPPVRRSHSLGRELRSSLGLQNDIFVFLAVGNVKPEKGFEDLIEAAGILHRGSPEQPFRVLIAGADVDRGYWKFLERKIAQGGLEGIVRLLGFRNDAQALYSAADAFVLSSRKESLPMVLLEAMSAGLPVVATRVGAVATVIENGIHGLLAKPACPDQMAGAMLDVLSHTHQTEAMGAAAARHVGSNYGVTRMTQEYLKAFRSAAAGIPGLRLAGNPCGPAVLHLGPQRPLAGGMAAVVDNLFASELARDFQLIGLNTGKTTREGRTLAEGIWSQWLLLRRLVRVIRKQGVQVCHIHTCEYLSFWRDCAHALLARWFGCKLVWHVHGARFDQWAQHLGPIRKRLVRAAFEMADAVIVLSHQWHAKLSPFAPGARWEVVENGIPMPPFATPMAPGRRRFLFLGDWTSRKGVWELVAATTQAVRERGFAGQVRLAGFEKEPGQRRMLDELLAGSGCARQVEVLGLVTGAAKAKELRECHCLVLPSYGEGLPLAILEAMGYGRAIIATSVGAIPELISDGVEGYLIAPGDVSALAERMVRIAEESGLAEHMGEAARQRVETRYALGRMAQEVGQLYKSVLSSSVPAFGKDRT